jgi:glycosyltransferase involved in cell wall biosynthesis
MFPRLSETFILNEMLELERLGANISIFSAKKPNEGKFHPQLVNLAANVLYLEGLETKKWINWLGDVWEILAPDKSHLWLLMEQAIASRDIGRLENVLHSAWVGAKIKELGIKHIHAHFASLPSTIAYYASLITGIPFSFTAHAKDIYVYQNDEYQLADKLNAAKFVVTVTEYNKKFLLTKTGADNKDKIKVIYNGIDLEKLSPGNDSRREENLILGIGLLVPKNGFDLLLKACKILKERSVSFRCQIVGDGSDAEMLHRLADELDLADRIEFLGPKRQDEIISLMHQGTIMCLPCRIAEDGNRDALPTVILEALASGLPVISTTISGIPEIIDNNKEGILVEPDNPQILAEKLMELLNSKSLRLTFADNGRKKAMAKFDIKRNIRQLYDLLNHKEMTG